MSQKEAEKPKTTRVSNPIAVSIHKIAAILDALPTQAQGTVLRTISEMYASAMIRPTD